MPYQFFRPCPKPKVILLMGGPASGKTSVARHFPELYHVSVSNILQKRFGSGHPHEALMRKGELIPDGEVFKALSKDPAFSQQKTVLLDGFPRNNLQLHYLKSWRQPDALIHLEARETTLRAYLKERGRSDDNEEAINKRMDHFYTVTEPMINSLKKQTPNSLTLNGDLQSWDEILESVRHFLIQKKLCTEVSEPCSYTI